MRVKDLPLDAQPRERLARLGPGSLSLQELVAILLRTGVKGRSVLEVAEEVVGSFPGDALLRASYDQFMQVKGLKGAKAVTLAAAVELARRLRSPRPKAVKLSSPSSVGTYLLERYADSRRELFGVLLLNGRNGLMSVQVLHEGTTQFAPVEPRFVFSQALNTHAARIILFHTHPSGDPEPSEDDLRFTRRLVQAGELLGIPVADHLIVGTDGYYSFREHRRI
ncbi:MAG TPA: DNA repair protein RadC [Thermoanaerobaculia bacterium]|mgnify:CR=1 FL=1|nr:DNA repair protein RadC [Thermoanaerobaculia bacterium]HUM30579.1 DNA repair protein RadC [Thermoanaerobaculia bacterium]HXK68771.1 DNA repair protein RadC [Thermoanaerobaculia bacterium]